MLKTFLAVEKQYGSFKKYLDSLDKSNNYENVVKDLINKFKWLGPPSASTFLYTWAKKSVFGIKNHIFSFLE